MHICSTPIPSSTHTVIRLLFSKCEISEQCRPMFKRRLKVMSYRIISCLLTLKLFIYVLEWRIVQFKIIGNVMVTICASHIDSLIVYEHFDGSGGGRYLSVGFSFKPRWSWLDSSKGQSNLGIRLYRKVALKGALIYMSIDKFSCAFWI